MTGHGPSDFQAEALAVISYHATVSFENTGFVWLFLTVMTRTLKARKHRYKNANYSINQYY